METNVDDSEDTEKLIATWIKEFDVEREDAENAIRAQKDMHNRPEEFENIFAFFIRRIIQEKDEARRIPLEDRWYCKKGERPMFDNVETLTHQDEEERNTTIFQYLSLWKATVDEKEEEPSSWSLDRRWTLVPVMEMPDSADVIEAKYGSVHWRFLYDARKRGVVALQSFLSGEIARSDVVRIRDHRGRSALHFAATSGNTDMIPFFRDLLNAFDRDGYTPLHTAIWFGKKDFVHALIQANADATLPAKDIGGLRPVEMARQYQWPQTENLICSLISLGRQKADVDALQ